MMIIFASRQKDLLISIEIILQTNSNMNRFQSDIGRKVILEVNTNKIKCMVMFRHQNAGQIRKLLTDNKSFKNVANFKYLGTTLTDQNCIQEEIRSGLNSGNARYYSVQSYCLPSSSLKI